MNLYTFFTTDALIEAIANASELLALEVARKPPAHDLSNILLEMTEELSRRYYHVK